MKEQKQSICGMCASGKYGTTDCCTSPFLRKHSGFCLSLLDVARIFNYTKMNPDSFCEISDIDTEDYQKNPDDYFSQIIFNGKILGMKGSGKCIFLGDKGCKIFKARPMVCRIHPLWFEEINGDINIFIDIKENCLILKRAKTPNNSSIYQDLKQSKEETIQIIRQFLKEVKAHQKLASGLNEKSMMEVLTEGNIIDPSK